MPFVTALCDNPTDDCTLGVFADYLEEVRDDPASAQRLRQLLTRTPAGERPCPDA
jgi:uncharacterized protein (TIGR02996 family)